MFLNPKYIEQRSQKVQRHQQNIHSPSLLMVYPLGGLSTLLAHADRTTSRANSEPVTRIVLGTTHPRYSRLATLLVRHPFQKHIEFCRRKSRKIPGPSSGVVPPEVVRRRTTPRQQLRTSSWCWGWGFFASGCFELMNRVDASSWSLSCSSKQYFRINIFYFFVDSTPQMIFKNGKIIFFRHFFFKDSKFNCWWNGL